MLFLTSAVSCSNFRPLVFTDAFLNPETTTEVTFEQLNFSYALFNQYASSLRYQFRLDYSSFNNLLVNQSIQVNGIPGLNYFNEWDIVTNTFAEALVVSEQWTQALNSILFDRSFDRVTKKATTTKELVLIKQSGVNNIVNFEIRIISSIDYKVNIGSAYMAFLSFVSAGINNYFNYILFFDRNNNLLQTYLLTQDRSITNRNFSYNLSEIVTNVRKFHLLFQWNDTPPFDTGGALVAIREFNLFTQNQELDIPDDTSGDRFGFVFVAVEWWNVFGHLQNFTWWIFNQSPIAPLFEFIEEYLFTWIDGLITFIVGIFRL